MQLAFHFLLCELLWGWCALHKQGDLTLQERQTLAGSRHDEDVDMIFDSAHQPTAERTRVPSIYAPHLGRLSRISIRSFLQRGPKELLMNLQCL